MREEDVKIATLLARNVVDQMSGTVCLVRARCYYRDRGNGTLLSRTFSLYPYRKYNVNMACLFLGVSQNAVRGFIRQQVVVPNVPIRVTRVFRD
jgi:hypothetical protein